jgi:hypothetical protein
MVPKKPLAQRLGVGIETLQLRLGGVLNDR